MAAAPKTVVTYNLTGAEQVFQIPFEYLARKFVQVALIGKDRKVLTLNIDYRFPLRTVITTTKRWGPSDGYDMIEIRRYTSATERLVDFSDGSILRAYDLNTSQVQSLHIAEEGRDVASDTIGVNINGDLDARARRIVNVADPIDDGDAVTMRFEKAWAASTYNTMEASKAAAQASQTSRLASEAARDSSIQAKVQSEASRDTTNTYKTQAQQAAANAEVSNTTSQKWAENPVDAPVVPGKFSALHHASKAVASANTATAQADRATTQAGLSEDSKVASETARDVAKNYATQVKDGTVPLFTVMWWGGKRSAIPGGYIPGDGQTINRVSFMDVTAQVENLMGTVADVTWMADPSQRGKWSAGDGTSTWRVPDLNGKSIGAFGAPFLRGDGKLSAAVAGIIRDSQNKEHTHGVIDPGHAHAIHDPGHSHVSQFLVGPAGPTFDPGILNTQVASNAGPIDRGTNLVGTGISVQGNRTGITIQVDGGTEARPVDLTGCWIIKVFGAVVNSGTLDASTIATDLALLTAKAVVTTTDTGWLPLPLAPGLAWIGQPWAQPRYRRRPDGTVMVRGLIITSPANGASFATLPVGFRPTENIRFVGCNADMFYYFDVRPDGEMRASGLPKVGSNISFECVFTTD